MFLVHFQCFLDFIKSVLLEFFEGVGSVLDPYSSNPNPESDPAGSGSRRPLNPDPVLDPDPDPKHWGLVFIAGKYFLGVSFWILVLLNVFDLINA